MARQLPTRLELIMEAAPGGRWAEFGVEWGRFAAQMLRRPDVYELWLVDCWGPYPEADPRDPAVLDDDGGERAYRHVYTTLGRDPRVRIYRGLIEQFVHTYEGGAFDLIYVDASHRYAHVIRHLELAYELLRPGGMLAGHDYYNTDGCPWIHVREAVDVFCRSRGLMLSYITLEACGSFAIIKPG